MNIPKINSVSLFQNINCKNNQINKIYNMPCDSVSFSGKKDVAKQEYSQTAQEGIAVGKKLLKLSRSNSLNYRALDNVLNENSPVAVNVESIQNIPNFAKGNFGRVVAHMLPGYTPDFKLAIANIYLGALPQTAKEEADFCANVAHEYTHVLQRANDTNYYGLSKYTQDPTEVTLIARTSKSLMDNMGQICHQNLFHSEREVRDTMNKILNNKFDIEKTLGKIDFNEIVDNTSNSLALQLGKDPEDMKNAVKGWIIQETQNEKEAYGVTLDVLERSKYDPNVKASRILSKEIYSYINKSLQENE